MNKKKKQPSRIRLNPIVKKDLKVISRSMKTAWGIFAYEAILALIFFFVVWLIFDVNSGYGYTNKYEDFVSLFPILAAVQFGIIALVMPVLTATAVSGEKEKQTFDLLLTTVMSSKAVVRGKVASAVIRMLIFIVASIPLMAVSFTIGGMSWWNLVIVMIAFLIFAVFAGSIGIFASTLTQKSITAIILTYVFYFLVIMVSLIPTVILLIVSLSSSSVIPISILNLINPVTAVIYMFFLMFGEDLFAQAFGNNPISFWSGWGWLALSGLSTLLISFGLQRLAAWRIDPLHGYIIRGGNKKAKKEMKEKAKADKAAAKKAKKAGVKNEK
ncbi:MAG: ABC transporter permease [Lachnospiraceae bacterium]|nr:ABC transporter permease [Lachnospiraceae bacterium]